MIKDSAVNKDNNIENTIKCSACGHTCTQVYIVKDNTVKDMQQYGEPFIPTMDKVVYTAKDKAQADTVYMCPKCGVLQTEVSKV